PYAPLGQSLGVVGGAREQALLLERAVSAIEPEQVGGAIVGHVEVEPAVAVEVGGDDTQAGPERLRDAGRLGDVREAAATVVAEETSGNGAVSRRAAEVARAHRVEADLVPRDREVEVIGDEQVQ